MIVMAGDQFTWIRQTYPDAPIADFGFAPLPAGPNGKSVSLVGGNIAMVSAKATPDQVEAAVYWRLFTQFDPAEILANYESGKTNPTVVTGSPTLPLYVGSYEAASEALLAQYANMPVANYKAFLDAISSGKASMQPEPLISGQEFYTAIGSVLSSVVTEKTANPTAVLKSAAATFQTNVLDLIKK
jgi:ABC-type glycerol-3-phosphate transport system substrate-binding protein